MVRSTHFQIQLFLRQQPLTSCHNCSDWNDCNWKRWLSKLVFIHSVNSFSVVLTALFSAWEQWPERTDTNSIEWRSAAFSLQSFPFCFFKTKRPLCREVWWCWKQNASKARALLLIWWCRCSSLKLCRAIAQLQGNATLSKQITVGDGGEKHIMLSSQEKLLWSTFKTIHQSHLQLSSQNEHN